MLVKRQSPTFTNCLHTTRYKGRKIEEMKPVKPRLLIIEDEESILQGLTDVFLYNGYEVESATEGHSGLEMALSGQALQFF